eukprot:TRINITY_DN48817_c0_g1_i1.p1 TRINITY_DN48817_c0_g1~~TRINITY_DN48817_c0_g1_i1.p1  ORF type:complete len:318 (+),score=22.37 TRINITY_DN48817_c0_g1_i1:93-956(+)
MPRRGCGGQCEAFTVRAAFVVGLVVLAVHAYFYDVMSPPSDWVAQLLEFRAPTEPPPSGTGAPQHEDDWTVWFPTSPEGAGGLVYAIGTLMVILAGGKLPCFDPSQRMCLLPWGCIFMAGGATVSFVSHSWSAAEDDHQLRSRRTAGFGTHACLYVYRLLVTAITYMRLRRLVGWLAPRGSSRATAGRELPPRPGRADPESGAAEGAVDAPGSFCEGRDLDGGGDGGGERDRTAPSGAPCVICMDLPPVVVLVPCLHQALCQECAREVHDCPLCRRNITNKITPYCI